MDILAERPLTLVVQAIGARSITESFDETVPRRIDITGLALITVGIGLFTLTFDRAPRTLLILWAGFRRA